MSILSCFFVLLLCLSKQDSCKARRTGARYNGIFAADFHHSGKVVSPIVEKVQLQTGSVDRGITINGGDGVGDHDHKDRNATREHAKKKSTRGKFSGVVLRNQPLVHVSWRVPSRKQDKYKNNHNKHKYPGLFSDYSRPRTRPPSHN